MKAIPRLLLIVLFVALTFAKGFGQSTSSKGTEFWTCWMDHINSSTGNPASYMILYITSDVSTSGTVSFADKTTSIPFNVTANVVTFVSIPTNQFLATEGPFTKGIHITSLKPIAVYAHIYASSVSGATLLLPVNTLGKNYTSINYTQISNTNGTPSYSTFAVIATEDNTTVEITPSQLLLSGKPAGTPFQVTLNAGQLYQGLSATDLTGTTIKSVSSAAGTATCKKIAVFSGSSKISIGNYTPVAPYYTNGSGQSADNLFQQVYPTATWGKNYITVSLKSRNYDVYRIVLSDKTTVVKLNGTIIPSTSFPNGFYDFTTSGVVTNYITADKPIQVAQYTPTQSQVLPGSAAKAETTGDPEMIYLSPIEQGLDHVTLYSTGYYAITGSYVNVVIPTSAVSTFTLDGVSYTAFTPVASNTAYSYAQIPVSTGPKSPSTAGTTSGTHNLKASQPFNAIAYGFGGTESYGYAAGTNLLNLNEQVQLASTDGNNTTSANGCTNTSYKLQLTLPYKPTSISWVIDGAGAVVDNTPTPTSQVLKGSVTLYTYEFANALTFAAGDRVVTATATNPLGDDCNSNDVIEFDFNISELPTAKFTAPDVCLGSPTVFTDQSGSNIKSWDWDFGDGTPHGNTATVNHTYATTGPHPVILTVTNENGCSSSTQPTNVQVNVLPQAMFSYTKPDCDSQVINFTDTSTPGDGTLTNWDWDFGDGTPHSNLQNPTHTYGAAGNYPIKLIVTSSTTCTSTNTSTSITVASTPQPIFDMPTSCVAGATVQFNDRTPITATTATPFKYDWDFGDGSPHGNGQTPAHLYTIANNYQVTLTVTTADGCSKTSAPQTYTVSGKAAFTAPDNACPNIPISFTDQTGAATGTVTAWSWDFGDPISGQKNTSSDQNPQHTFVKPGDYTVTLTVSSNSGCSVTSFPKKIHIYQASSPGFKITGTVCAGQVITFNDASTPGESAITNWNYDFGDAANSTTTNPNTIDAKNPTHVFTTAGYYDIVMTTTDANGCSSGHGTTKILVYPSPVVDFRVPDVCLVNSVATFYDNGTKIAPNTAGGAPSTPLSYSWVFDDPNSSAGNLNTSSDQNPTHKFTKPGTYHVSLTVTSNNSCPVTVIKDYVVTGQAAFTVQASACPGEDVVFTDTTDPSGKTVTGWHWDFKDGSPIDTRQKPSHQFVPGDYAVTLTVDGNNGCSSTTYTMPVPLHVTSNPKADFAWDKISCETQTLQFHDKSSTAEGTVVAWKWNFGDANASAADNVSTDQNPTHTFSVADTYHVTLQVTKASGCVSEVTNIDVPVYPLPNASFTLPGACLDDTPQFTAGFTEAGAKYHWDFGDTFVPTAADTSNLQNPTHKYGRAGTYNVALTVTSQHGCTVTSKPIPMTVNGISPKAGFNVNTPEICSSEDALFTNTTVTGYGGLTKVVMYWDANDLTNTTTYTGADAQPGAIMRHNYGRTSSGNQRTFQVRMYAYSGNSASCTDFTKTLQSVKVNPNPDVSINQLAPMCQQDTTMAITVDQKGFTGTGTFTAALLTNNTPGTYTDTFVKNGIFNPKLSGPGTFLVSYVFTSGTTGCRDTVTEKVVVYPNPVINAGPALTLLEGGSVTLKATNPNNEALTYSWTMADGTAAIKLDHTDVLTPVASPTSTVTYKLTARSGNGCTASSTVTITVLKTPIVPNTFTPNGDGVNDKWEIKYLNTYPNATVEVFNRTGGRVYSSAGYNVSWDGTYNGQPLPVGTYYYIISPKNGRVPISGSVTIVR